MADEEGDSEAKQRLLAELDAEIAEFAKRDIPLPEEHVPPAMVSTGFPRLDLKPAEKKDIAPSSKTPALAVDYRGEDHRVAVASGSLLARLKDQAAARLAEETQRVDLEEQTRRQISDSLQQTYLYLRDFVNQVNIIKPAYPGNYYLNEQLVFDKLSWREGRADLRKLEDATDTRRVERVTLRYLLAGDVPITIDRENPAMEILDRTLRDYDLKFTFEGFKNERARTERGRFTVQREIRAGLLFVADYATGDIRLRSLNVQRLGSAEYRIPADALDTPTIEEIALLVLGESSQFVRRFRRVM
jgi:hypothetical protein